MPQGLYAFGLVCLLVATTTTGLLAFEKLGAISLPGCGEHSACASAQSSAWGRIPLPFSGRSDGKASLPVSFLGFGYFVGLLLAWLRSHRGVSFAFRLLVRLGGLVSLLYLAVIVVQGHYCLYCIATHIANFAFVAVVERYRLNDTSLMRPVIITAVVMIAANAVLLSLKVREERLVAERNERDLAASTDEIIAESARKADNAAIHSASSADTQPAQPDSQPAKPWTGNFTGRYREGPEKAPIRIVLFTDYQCPDCYNTENDIKDLMTRRSDVSVSVKHFPMCKDCNRHLTQTMHANACWAARCAEAAGILRGNEGFWQMHHLLFDRKGNFTNQDLQQILAQLGYEPAEFTRVLMGDQTLSNVQKDVEEGVAAGLYFTPMVFINGVELKGVLTMKAVSRAVEALARTNPPAMGPELDDPPLAAEKYIADWRENVVRPIPIDATTYPRGPDGARLRIAMFGDYQETGTANADRQIRALIANRDDVQYVYRSYPFDQTCNPHVRQTMFPKGCLAARAAKAAGILGGADGFWRMHEWLMVNQATFSEQTLAAAAPSLGFDPATLNGTMLGTAVDAAIVEDVKHGRYMIPKGLPTIYVNGKFIPRWMREGDNVLERIINEASGPGRQPANALP